MSQQQGQGASQIPRPHTAYVLSLIGSVLMLISSLMVLAAAGFMSMYHGYFAFHRFGYYPMMPMFVFTPVFFVIVGIVGLVVSVLALYFSIRLGGLSDVGSVHSIGVVLLVLAIIGLFVANGFFVGFILLLIGSILALTWKP